MRPHILLLAFSRVVWCGDAAAAAGCPFWQAGPAQDCWGQVLGGQGTVSARSLRNCSTSARSNGLLSPNGLETVNAAAAGPGDSRIRRGNPGTYWTPDLGQLHIAAGHRSGTQPTQDCQSVRIYASELCPRQDSNLRSRLRRPVLFVAATWQNACWRPRWGAYVGRAMGGEFGADVPWCFQVTASMVPAVGRLAGAC